MKGLSVNVWMPFVGRILDFKCVVYTSRLFAASSGKTDLYPVYQKRVIVILGVREKILFHAEGSLVKWRQHTLNHV